MPKNQLRDEKIYDLYRTEKMTLQAIADLYHLTRGRIHQIVSKEKKKHETSLTGISSFLKLCDRLDIMYHDIIAGYLSREDASCRGILYKTRFFAFDNQNRTFDPHKWITWLKQATNEDFFKVKGIGPKKGTLLIIIKRDILSHKEKEEILLKKVQKLF